MPAAAPNIRSYEPKGELLGKIMDSLGKKIPNEKNANIKKENAKCHEIRAL